MTKFKLNLNITPSELRKSLDSSVHLCHKPDHLMKLHKKKKKHTSVHYGLILYISHGKYFVSVPWWPDLKALSYRSRWCITKEYIQFSRNKNSLKNIFSLTQNWSICPRKIKNETMQPHTEHSKPQWLINISLI